MSRVSLCFIVSLILGCSPAPRYGSKIINEKKNSTSREKVVKHRTTMSGVSSFYAEDFHGKVTANGETYDMYGLTVAHKTLPFNTIIKVTNLDNDQSLTLRVNDRGPYAKGRILDCSYGAAVKLGFVANGTARVKIEVIEFGDNKYMKRKDN